MKHFKYVAAIAIVGSGLSMGTVDARANFDGDDIFTPGGTFIEDVFDTRDEAPDGGRDSDIDVCNRGAAYNLDARGKNSADVNDPDNCDD